MMRSDMIRNDLPSLSALVAVLFISLTGCGSPINTADTNENPNDSQRAIAPPVDDMQSNANLRQLADQQTTREEQLEQELSSDKNAESEIIATPDADVMPSASNANASDSPESATVSPVPQRGIERRAVRSDLSDSQTPEKLIELLGVIDRDMRDIWGKMQQVEGGQQELMRVARLKLQATQQLKNHEMATDAQKSLAARGELQALSHLASFNDLDAATNLKIIAASNLNSKDSNLISDSRLVLIGFALEGLRQGNSEAKSELMEYLLSIRKENASNDIPTLMVLGQARDTLAAYGEQALANQVRNKILELYRDSANPDIRTAANDLANHIYYDEVETLLSSARNGSRIDLPKWQFALNKLIEQTGDMRCVQYLASASLQLEGLKQFEAVNATFTVLNAAFNEPATQMSQEVEIASSAYRTRQEIIGTEFQFDLPLVNREVFNEKDYQGKVILVPFWTVTLPESLQIMKILETIRDQSPDQVTILGINLDGDETLLQEFLKQNDLPFQNLHAKSKASDEVLNETATKYGITSMPFLAIVDQNQKIVEINFTGQGIEQTVNGLIQSGNESNSEQASSVQ